MCRTLQNNYMPKAPNSNHLFGVTCYSWSPVFFGVEVNGATG